MTVRNGAAGDLLLYAAERWDAEVEDIDNIRGGLDDWGYAERPIRGGVELSNHASGTAIDLNATKHPLGAAAIRTFTTEQIRAVRRIMADCGGALRWGGDYSGRPDPMHIEVVVNQQRCARVLLRIMASSGKPSKYPTIQRGSTGDAVKLIQRFLGVVGPDNAGYGVFGPATESAVKAYQKMKGLTTDGVVGPATWAATEL